MEDQGRLAVTEVLVWIALAAIYGLIAWLCVDALKHPREPKPLSGVGSVLFFLGVVGVLSYVIVHIAHLLLKFW